MPKHTKPERVVAVTRDRPAPYAPPKVILGLIDRHRDRGLPAPVNGEVLGRAGVSDSLIPRTLQALQTLDLINEAGAPTPILESLRLAPAGEFQQRLADWIRAAYADAFNFVDPTKDDETRIRDAFRSYQPIGQQDRMVTLFQGLCAAAGLTPEKPSSPPPKSARPRSPGIRVISKPVPRKVLTPAPSKDASALPSPVTGLLEHLPTGEGWTRAKREKWLTAFETVLDLCYPLIEETHETVDDE